MTFNELVAKLLDVLPNALFDEGQDGELIISTGLKVPKGGNDDTELEKVEK